MPLAVFVRAVALLSEKLHSHVEWVARYATVIARKLGWSEPAVATLGDAARIHEAGKIGLTSDTLLKPYAGLAQQIRWDGPQDLEPGMVVADVLKGSGGEPFLEPGTRLTRQWVRRLRRLEVRSGGGLQVVDADGSLSPEDQ